MHKNWCRHIVVLSGGMSAEREVSLSSGITMVSALSKMGYSVTSVILSQENKKSLGNILIQLQPDVVFNALHGTYGEDGAIQGLLEILGIRYTHSGLQSAAICINKMFCQHVVSQFGIKVPNFLVIDTNDFLANLALGQVPMQYPFVIKPLCQGSSLGIYILKSLADLPAVDTTLYGKELMIQEYIPGQEISVPVIRGKACGVIELETAKFYDYEAKYTDGVTVHIFPANLPEEAQRLAIQWAEEGHKIFGCRTVSRSDFRYDNIKGELYWLEINTHPGFTSLSLVAEVAEKVGISLEAILDMLIEDSRCDLNPTAENAS